MSFFENTKGYGNYFRKRGNSRQYDYHTTTLAHRTIWFCEIGSNFLYYIYYIYYIII